MLQLELDEREHDDPCPYLLAIWMPGKKILRLKYYKLILSNVYLT